MSDFLDQIAGNGAAFAAVIVGAVIATALFAANIFTAARRGGASYALTLGSHVIAIITIIGNIMRIITVETGSIVLGNLVALCCVSFSLYRRIKEHETKEGGTENPARKNKGI